jgi:hypothetical protein
MLLLQNIGAGEQTKEMGAELRNLRQMSSYLVNILQFHRFFNNHSGLLRSAGVSTRVGTSSLDG